MSFGKVQMVKSHRFKFGEWDIMSAFCLVDSEKVYGNDSLIYSRKKSKDNFTN